MTLQTLFQGAGYLLKGYFLWNDCKATKTAYHDLQTLRTHNVDNYGDYVNLCAKIALTLFRTADIYYTVNADLKRREIKYYESETKSLKTEIATAASNVFTSAQEAKDSVINQGAYFSNPQFVDIEDVKRKMHDQSTDLLGIIGYGKTENLAQVCATDINNLNLQLENAVKTIKNLESLTEKTYENVTSVFQLASAYQNSINNFQNSTNQLENIQKMHERVY